MRLALWALNYIGTVTVCDDRVEGYDLKVMCLRFRLLQGGVVKANDGCQLEKICNHL